MPWQPDYVTLTELKSFARIGDTADDAELGFAITAASRAIDEHTNRQFGQLAAPELRRYTPWLHSRTARWVASIDDVQTASGFLVEIEAGAIILYDLEPANAAAEGRPWTRLVIKPTSTVQPKGEPAEVQVTGQWGWTAVPVPVKEATLLQASRFFARRNSPYGVAGSPDAGSELRLLARVDPDVGVSLRSYLRGRVVR